MQIVPWREYLYEKPGEKKKKNTINLSSAEFA